MDLIQPDLTAIGDSVLKKRYLLRSEKGEVIETPRDRFVAVAKHVAAAERIYGIDPETIWPSFYQVMAHLDFLPNTPCIANAGRPGALLSACIVLPVEDSMPSIFGTLRDMALCHQRGAGTGFSFSQLRPAGDFVASTTGLASGPISFMHAYNTVTECVKQSGIRRGANMAIMRCDHPDILAFIDCKRDLSKLCNFNISVGITDAFMTALATDGSYALVNPRTGLEVKQLRAQEVFDRIIANAHATGEPGLLFLDRVNALDPVATVEDPIEATNPCVVGDTMILTAHGEQRIDSRVDQMTSIWNGEEWSDVLPRVTARDQELLHVNFADGRGLTCTHYHRFYLSDGAPRRTRDLKTGDVLENHHLPDGSSSSAPIVTSVSPAGVAKLVYCFNETKRHRGLFNGILTGQCGEQPLHPYDACDLGSINVANFYDQITRELDVKRLADVVGLAVRFLDNVHDVNEYPVPQLAERTHNNRRVGLGVMGWADLLIKMGIPYGSAQALSLAENTMQFINAKAVEASERLAETRGAFPLFDRSKHAANKCKQRRNATVTTIAPTGSISIIAGCSSGIEPLFAIVQTRKQADMQMVDVNPLFVAIAKRERFYSESLMQRVSERGTVRDDPDVPRHWQNVFAIANEIDPEYHVRMQAAFQKHVECAVSKTVNMPRHATTEEVQRVYTLAWEQGCKGITVYRDGCRDQQTLSVGTADKPELHAIPTGPYDLKAQTVTTPTGKLSVKLGLDALGRPFEVWLNVSRAGTAVSADCEALARCISLLLRLDSPITPERRLQLVIDQLHGIGGGDAAGFGPHRVLSLPDGVAKALRLLAQALEPDPAPSEPVHETPVPGAPTASQSHEPIAKGNGHGNGNGNGHGNGHRQTFGDICPECHQLSLHYGEGCAVCNACGFSRC